MTPVAMGWTILGTGRAFSYNVNDVENQMGLIKSATNCVVHVVLAGMFCDWWMM